MEQSFIGTPYSTAHSAESGKIRELLDREENEYVTWRSSRKHVRHPFASAKLNAPLGTLQHEQAVTNQVAKPLWMALLEQTEEERPITVSTFRSDGLRTKRNGFASQSISRCSSRGCGPATPNTGRTGSTRSELRDPTKHLDASDITTGSSQIMTLSQSTPLLPSALSGTSKDQPLTVPVKKTVGQTKTVLPAMSTSAVKRKLHRHLYNYHSSLVFSLAPNENEDAQYENNRTEDITQQEENHDATNQPVPDQSTSVDVLGTAMPRSGRASKTIADRERFIIQGLPVMTKEDMRQIFDYDWNKSDVESIVRDAVERKRIYRELESVYRVVLLYFRYYAGKTALERPNSAATYNMDQIPCPVSLLEDLNVPVVDPTKYGIQEGLPLQRDGLVNMLLHTANMMAAHPRDPTRFRMLAIEGIELSVAVRCLLRDHFVLYAQIQDPRHFRATFLRDEGKSSSSNRPLKQILADHKPGLLQFFYDMIAGRCISHLGFLGRMDSWESSRGNPNPHGPEHLPTSGSGGEPSKALPTMSFTTFVKALKAIHVIPASQKKEATLASEPSVSASTAGTANAVVVVLDDSRAMRIFQSCLVLDVSSITQGNSNIKSADEQKGIANSASGHSMASHLCFPQFVEALLRVALIQNEVAICCGGFDVCPNQLTSDWCECRPDSLDRDLAAFDAAVEDLFIQIRSHRFKTAKASSIAKITTIRMLEPTKPSHQ